MSQVDVTSCQGVLFSLCVVLLLCAITISIVVPLGYVSSPLRSEIDVINDLNKHSRISLDCVCAFITQVPWLHATYAVLGAILFTMVGVKLRPFSQVVLAAHSSFPPQFLAFDTQMLLGNKRYAISPEEYIFATLSIYLDIVNLFSFLLQIVGGGRE